MDSTENVLDEQLPERQRTFLERLRQHDHRVKVVRVGGQMTFHGPVIGDGPMPVDRPAPDGAEEEEP